MAAHAISDRRSSSFFLRAADFRQERVALMSDRETWAERVVESVEATLAQRQAWPQATYRLGSGPIA